MPRNLMEDIDHVLIDREKLTQRVDELVTSVAETYQDVDQLVVLGVLKGAVVFMTEFSMRFEHPHQLEFMAVSSYGAGTESSGVVRIVMDLETDIAGRHVLILEDIIDSGRTLAYLRELLLARNPASLRICTLLNKPSRRAVDVPVDWVGFDIPDEFVVGYGLDFNELYRNIPYIAVLKPACYS